MIGCATGGVLSRLKAIILLPLFVFSGCGEKIERFVAPIEGDVSEMTLGCDWLPEKVPGTGGNFITVPKSGYGGILGQLNGAAKDHDPMKWVVFADLWITSKSKVIHVQIFRTDEKRGAIKVDHGYYRTADEGVLLGMIRGMLNPSAGSGPNPGAD